MKKKKERQWCIPGRRFFENTRKILKSNFVLVVVLVFESKGPYYHLGQKMQRKYWSQRSRNSCHRNTNSNLQGIPLYPVHKAAIRGQFRGRTLRSRVWLIFWNFWNYGICQDILKEQCPRGLLAKKEHFAIGANCLWDRSPVMLRNSIQALLNFFWSTPKKLEGFVWTFLSITA